MLSINSFGIICSIKTFNVHNGDNFRSQNIFYLDRNNFYCTMGYPPNHLSNLSGKIFYKRYSSKVLRNE